MTRTDNDDDQARIQGGGAGRAPPPILTDFSYVLMYNNTIMKAAPHTQKAAPPDFNIVDA